MTLIDIPVAGRKREKKASLWERDALDWYVEPIEATRALLSVEGFVGKIWDPACGQGNICIAALAHGFSVVGTDIVLRTNDLDFWLHDEDFLKVTEARAPNIICNPPFFRAKGTEAFIRKALSLATGKVAIFVDIRFLAGAERANGIFLDHPPSRIWIVTPRVSCPPGSYLAAGNKACNGSSDWCWLIWDLTAPREMTHFGWLRRKEGPT